MAETEQKRYYTNPHGQPVQEDIISKLWSKVSSPINMVILLISIGIFIICTVDVSLLIDTKHQIEKDEAMQKDAAHRTSLVYNQLHEVILPLLTAISDVVSFQIPRSLSEIKSNRILSQPCPLRQTTEEPEPAIKNTSVYLCVKPTDYFTPGSLGNDQKLAAESELVVELPSYIRSLAYNSHPAEVVWNLPFHACRNLARLPPISFTHNYLGVKSWTAQPSCELKPVLAVGNGTYALTYTVTGPGCSLTKVIGQYFEVGTILIDNHKQPYLKTFKSWVRVFGEPLFHCSAAVDLFIGYFTCSFDTSAVLPFARVESALRLLFIKMPFFEPYTESLIQSGNIISYYNLMGLQVVPGKSVVHRGKLTVLGAATIKERLNQRYGCRVDNCPKNQNDNCNQYTRILSNGVVEVYQILISIDLSPTRPIRTLVHLIPPSEYQYVKHGSLYYDTEEGNLYASFSGSGWAFYPTISKIIFEETIRMENKEAREFRSTRTGTCTQTNNCPKDCRGGLEQIVGIINPKLMHLAGIISQSPTESNFPIIKIQIGATYNQSYPVFNSDHIVTWSQVECYPFEQYVWCSGVVEVQLSNPYRIVLGTINWPVNEYCQD